ncbi:outer membrane protein assembly factor BamE [Atopomonas sediminilitoris]|uniref:outer membrane protein assembly factor BamE n=1 Tax=Atopomonas sediminilitoris TaxID=2919919 RepID=UPI001F4D4F61|nr:outer membrane protein assembly factor BamE [Atopomonas sediminilitoris]MCJ8169581.1 outer membrane protein assembly factor BamE [Atopomonas sediminilitoris]
MRSSLLAGTALLALTLLSGCSKVNQQHYDQLKVGMSKAEVETLLGAGECEGAMGATSCEWGDDKTGISVQFLGDKVMLFSGRGLK